MLFADRLHKLAAYIWVRLRSWIIGILRAGPIPKHIAFIMDGNRRFAKKQGLQSISGHQQGYLKLLDALQWCLDLGVQAITVYAFSIDNFRRESDEVDALMTLAEEKLLDLLNHKDIIDTNRVQVRIIGDLSLLPARVQQAADRVMKATCHHQRCKLNICMAYTSRQEMAHAVHAVQQRMDAGSIAAQDITGSTLEEELYTQGCPAVDLLIRTSGEHRLSDFLLWQSSYAQLVFSDTLWPDYSFWNLLQALVQYQRSYPELQKLQDAHQKAVSSASDSGQEGSIFSRQSTQAHEVSEAEACPAVVDIAADAYLQNVVDVGKVKANSHSADSLREVTDVDTSDSSASSESRTASPTQSPARPSRSISPEGQDDMGAASAWHQESNMQASQEDCDESSARLSDSKQAQDGSLTDDNSSIIALCPSVQNGNKQSSRTLHADVDCRTASMPSLGTQNTRREPRDDTC